MLTSIKNIAFYAPLKSPDHPVPSGDREIARLFIKALKKAGFDVTLASHFRSFDKSGAPSRQKRLIEIAQKLAIRILDQWQQQGYRPDAWFCYHLYYKAPDLIGPIICAKLNIPYIAAEVSWAKKRAQGKWAHYHNQLQQCLYQADRLISINPVDIQALTDLFPHEKNHKLHYLPAFIADKPPAEPKVTKASIANQFNLNPRLPWLVTIAMMREGDKFSSYQYLNAVMASQKQPCELLIIGDGNKADVVKSLFASHENVHFAGQLDNSVIKQCLPYFDILIWPAINEALGMIFLEAQQAGVSVIAGDEGGVSSVVAHQQSGILVNIDDPQFMATSLDSLLADANLLTQFKQNAQVKISGSHSIETAAHALSRIILGTAQRKVT